MGEWHYVYAGLRVSSALELPEWDSFVCHESHENPDVLIRLDDAPQVRFVTLSSRVSAREFHFSMPDVGSYLIKDGKEIVVSPVTEAGQNEVRLFLLGSAWGALCYQRGVFAVHAGAVRVGDEAVLFCAPQGGGKSTMTAWLALHGHALVSDDLCCINMSSPDTPLVYPSTQRLRLWRDALMVLGRDSDQLERDHFRFDKYLLPWRDDALRQALPLRAIYLLEWGEAGLRRLSGLRALERFVSAATYRGELLQQMGLSGAYWQSCLQLLQKVPVWGLAREKDLTKLGDAADILAQHWRGSEPTLRGGR